MRSDPQSGSAARAHDDASNPFSPIDYASRLKAPPKREHAHTASMQPLKPGQLYGAHWMSPPKPFPPPAEQHTPAPAQPAWDASGPMAAAPKPAAPFVPEASPGMSAPSALPPYLQRRPAVGRAARRAAEPPEVPRVDLYGAPRQEAPAFAPPAGEDAAAPRRSRRSRAERHREEDPAFPAGDAQADAPAHDARPPYDALFDAPSFPGADAPAQFGAADAAGTPAYGARPHDDAPAAFAGDAPEQAGASMFDARPYDDAPSFFAADAPAFPDASSAFSAGDTLPPLPEMPDGLASPFAQDENGEPPLFPEGGTPGAPYAPSFSQPHRPEPDEPLPPAGYGASPADEAVPLSPAPQAPAPQNRPRPEGPPLRDPFSPAEHTKRREASSARPPRKKADRAPSARRSAPPQRPPVRPARVAALIAAFMMLVFCAVEGGRILVHLSQNEREMESVRESYRERTGMDLQSGAARVDLLPAGQTYEPTASPAPTQAVQTPSPTPVIPIRENAVQSLNKRDTSSIQSTAEPTDTPSARTRLSEYPDNPLKNIMPSLLSLREENSDVVGHLTIPGVVDEVVVQRSNTYYLTRNYRGTSSDAGAVFVDEGCTFRSPPENLLLRGQSAVEGKVFAPLWQYVSGGRDFVAGHTVASLTTLYEEADYVLFAVIVADSDPTSSGYFNYASNLSFDTDAAMLAYVESARSHSLYTFSTDVVASDRLLTLATIGGSECLVLLFRQMR